MAVPCIKSIWFLRTSANLTRFSQYRELSTTELFGSLLQSILELLLMHNYRQRALELFLNIVYYYPQSHCISFEKKYGRLVSSVTKAILNNDRNLKVVIYSSALLGLFKTISEFIENYNNNLASFKDVLSIINVNVLEIGQKLKKQTNSIVNYSFAVFLLRKQGKVYFLFPKTRLVINNQLNKSSIVSDDEINEDLLSSTLNNDPITTETFYVSDNLKKIDGLVDFDIKKYNPGDVLQQFCYCGAVLCLECTKKLKRTTHFLINSSCCAENIYNSNPYVPTKAIIDFESSANCIFCDKTSTKSEIVYCICCFLNNNIYKNTLKRDKVCGNTGCYYWVDINYGQTEDLDRCGFCAELRNKFYICSACNTCKDQVCISCLRKNIYIPEGVCSTCKTKRIIKLNYI
jgi:hypothetical protein